MPNYVENQLNIVQYAPQIFFASILVFLLIGWIFGRYRTRTSEHVVVRDSLATAIFGLSALVLGFTFSNATEHYDKRISLIRDQAYALKQVYQSSNYLNTTDRITVQNTLKQILIQRMSKYENLQKMDDLDSHNDALAKSLNTLNEEINQSIGRAPVSTKNLADAILRPQLTNLLDVFQEGILNGKRHPPAIIDRFLFALLSIGALLSGYSMAVKKEEDWFLTALYLGLIWFALHVIFALEFPHQLQDPHFMNADFIKLQKVWQ
ncbi:hypothetical protein [Polynucleobacter sp. AP-Kaivos-20-H2]|uniref:hypothetical protein n=1 Tax=Polynucleobacter sp. AP-Kaivos-20-H2 TaxID=2689104 RepID=UPI001C0D9223|nr:hypothetical protein [Polynucleobacter sp. AP-Kaivos-20-H2]MBU3604773.1 hypothetical protein [Polynucleobacter sp. AP-Kaivos-20-H2]